MKRAHVQSLETGVDEERFRLALGRFATGVAVVTARDHKGDPFAITINAFTSVSLDPPLILYCLGKSAFNYQTFAKAGAFAINFLSADQQALSDRFAREGEDHFPDLELGQSKTGSPRFSGCLGVLECMIETRHEAGDHLIIVGRVVAADSRADLQPLVYFGSRYRALKPGDDG